MDEFDQETLRLIHAHFQNNNLHRSYRILSITALYNERYLIIVQYSNLEYEKPVILYKVRGISDYYMECEGHFGHWIFDEAGNGQYVGRTV